VGRGCLDSTVPACDSTRCWSAIHRSTRACRCQPRLRRLIASTELISGNLGWHDDIEAEQAKHLAEVTEEVLAEVKENKGGANQG
jgi:hypothetical protein